MGTTILDTASSNDCCGAAALRSQQTIARTATVSGFGYWSGQDVRVEFQPADSGTGIVFVRTDVDPPAEVAALVKHRIEIPRRTTLARGAAQVEMVEHILAALAGLQIDNCRVCVDAGEMPGCDGSSLAFVHALTAAGIVRQDALRPQRIVRQPVRVADGDTWVEARPAFPGSRVSLRFQIDYGAHRAIGRQRLQMELTPEVFCRELAPSRTFLLEDEARWLQQQGLARRVTAADLLVFGDDGPIDNETRFDDECVRHKALDLVGDLALAGCDIIGHFVAHRSGHRLNAELVRALLVECEVVDAVRR